MTVSNPRTKRSRIRRLALNTLLFITATVAAFLCAEAVAHLYLNKVAFQGKLFQPDRELGWKPLPGLHSWRKNAEGALYDVVTNAQGFRGPLHWDPASVRKVLILGDSFAFGEGVAIEDRFDGYLKGEDGPWSVLNRGVPGFGPGQAILAGQGQIADLSSGDAVVLLTFRNDFYDLARRRASGRWRPTFRRHNGSVIAEPVGITWRDHLVDRSYIAGMVFRTLDRRQHLSHLDIQESAGLYERLVATFLLPATGHGVEVYVVYHGIGGEPDARRHAAMMRAFETCCSRAGMHCLDLDSYLDEESYFLKDGHWSAAGHAVVGNQLYARLRRP